MCLLCRGCSDMTKNGSLKQEQNFIKSIGGTPHRNSGRGMKPGDGSWHQFVIDVKHRIKSFTLDEKVWAKICTDTVNVSIDKEPALIVVFDSNIKLAVIALDTLEELIEAADQGRML